MNPSATPPPRIAWVDYAKGIGIILVVVGHVLRGLQKTPVHVPGWEFADTWIYAFHMPLFFYLSGLFAEHSCHGTFGQYFGGKARRILWPYFVWTVFQEAFRHLAGSSPLRVADLWTIVYRPVMQFWFLYVLFLLLVLYAAWRMSGGPWQLFVALAFALNLSLAFGVNYGPWGVIYQMWLNIPYLALGVLVAGLGKLDYVESFGTPALAAMAVCGYLAIASAVSFHVSGLAFAVVPLAAVGIFSSVALSGCLARWRPAAGVAEFGVLSLEIFVAHTIFASAFRQALLAAGIRSATLHVAGGVAIGLAGPVVLHALFKRFHLLFLFSLPARRRHA